MEHLLQENLSKLLPLWHDLSLQDIAQNKSNKRYLHHKLPDFGGAGVDFFETENDLKCYETKHTPDEISFKTSVCSLPFFSPHKVSLKSDPCLTSVKTSKSKLNKFCVMLDHLRRSANNTDGKFKNELLAASKIAKSLCSKKSKSKLKKFIVSDTIIQLATEFPKSIQLPEANFDYLGGCLTSSQTSDKSQILLHPVGKKLNKLGVTPLVEICDSDKTFQPGYSETTAVKLKKNCIHKILSTFPGYCFVQQGKFCHFVNFTNPSNISTAQLFREKGTFVNITASPYTPYELVSINRNGILEVHDVDTRETCWTSDQIFYAESTLKACAFGSHPKSVLALSEDAVYAYDLRLGTEGESIILSEHFSKFYEEKFLNLTSLALVNPFQHLISSTNHLYICDERYPTKPVLIWSHQFKSNPLYCDVACYNSKDASDFVILLGSQESRELSLFTVRSQDCQIQPVSLNTPFFLSSPSDFTDSLRLHGINVNEDLLERITNPLVGVCAIPHSKKTGFTAFQLSSFGDVFYQDFGIDSPMSEEHTYRVDTGCILIPPDRILPHLSKWMDFFSKSSKKAHSSRSNLVSVNVDLRDIQSNSPDVSSGCDFCCSNAYSCDREVVSTVTCSSCGLDNLQAEKFLDAFSNLGLLAGPVIENTDLDDFDVAPLSDFYDEYSQRILTPWNTTLDDDGWVDDDSQISRLSFDSSKSGASHSTIGRNDLLDSSTQDSDVNASEPTFEGFLLDNSLTNLPSSTQDSGEEWVAPSQDIRPITGETLRSDTKIQVESNSSLAGF